MKAILKYGQFTSMIELPERMYTVHIMKPMDELSFIPLETRYDVSEVKSTKLEFRIKEQLTQDIYLYEFVSES